MNANRFRLALIAVSFLLTIATYKAGAWGDSEIDQTTNNPRPVESAREAMISNQLRSVLSTVGVSVADVPTETQEHRRLTVHWQSGQGGSKSLHTERPKGVGVLTFNDSPARAGAVARPRNVELSNTQTLVIAVNENQQLMWWNQFPDPRILRAEVPDANGQQHIGRTFYLTETDFSVAYPNNPAIRELRFYQPVWTSNGFQLELIGSVSVNSF